MKRAVLYLRVSTLDQTTANQERELREVAERAGWQVTKFYKDHGAPRKIAASPDLCESDA
jgi:DNA invertase Pin-like site-specific DNA recombinase